MLRTPRYGRKVRKLFGETLKIKKKGYECPKCEKVKVKRIGFALYQCKSCGVKIAGAAYSLEQQNKPQIPSQ